MECELYLAIRLYDYLIWVTLDLNSILAIWQSSFINLSCMYQLYSRDGSKWKVEENSHLVMKEPSANMILLDYVSTQKWEGIIDFDDHLDDISK